MHHEITHLLIQWRNGDRSALDRLMPLVYHELHKLAKRYVGQQNTSNTLQTTALIHEAYLKLRVDSGRQCKNRDHFFAVAAKAMRHILVDHARADKAYKRGGAMTVVSLEDEPGVPATSDADVIALDDALTALAKLHPRQSDAVELRYFGGLSLEQSAKVLQVSPDTVLRDLRFAKAWLKRELRQ